MNELGLLLIGTVGRVTVLATLGAALAAVLRRRGPASGSLAALATLSALVGVTFLSLSPWPRFWTFDLDPGATVAVQSGVSREDAGKPPGEASPVGVRPSPSDGDWVRTFAREFVRELNHTRNAGAPHATGWGSHFQAWRWPAWVAAGLFAAWAVGLARLALAVRAVAGVRRRSREVGDPALDAEVEALRGEIGLTRPVELRVTDELATPATVGWLRPVVLLPPDWRTWDAPERRAVLAHELAHARRGDYLTGLWSQICLALHVYHPLAHWIVARLRLDQELVADAWAARLAGGNRPYLTALARLALRRSEPPAVRLARPFLPSRNAFLRRIEMLRDAKTDPVRSGPLPPLGRWLTAAALAALALAVSGLRGPGGLPEARAQQGKDDNQSAEIRKKIRDLNAQLEDLERQNAAKNPNRVDPFDPTRAPAGAAYMVVGKPSALLTRPEFKPLADIINERMTGPHSIGIPAEQFERFALLLPRSPARQAGPYEYVVSLRTSQPQVWKSVQSRLLGEYEEIAHSGTTYARSKTLGGQVCYTPDDRTLVAGPEGEVIRVIDALRPGVTTRHPWDEAWDKLPKSGLIRVALDPAYLAASLPRNVTPGSPQAALAGTFSAFAPLFDKATGYAAALDDNTALTLEAVATCASDDSARSVDDTVKALVTLGKNAAQGMRQQPGIPAEVSSLVSLGSQLLDGTRIERDGKVVLLHSKAEVDLAGLVNATLPSVMAARAAARRAQSMNNIKQIMLAFHNYQSAEDHFPPAVLRGPDGKTPYSWRVAILPYIEQNELYNAYDRNQPWDSPKNLAVLEKMPAIYAHPSESPPGRNAAYFVPVGRDTLFPPDSTGTKMAEITDGMSNTIAVVEAKRDIPWTKPEDIAVTPLPDLAVPELGGFTPDVFLAGLADGSVRTLNRTINTITLKALLSRAGGEVIDFNGIMVPRGNPPGAQPVPQPFLAPTPAPFRR